MHCYGDKTYCVSPNCKNKCGRKLTEAIRAASRKAGLPLSLARFCDDEKKAK